jgi:hypothetical protein
MQNKSVTIIVTFFVAVVALLGAMMLHKNQNTNNPGSVVVNNPTPTPGAIQYHFNPLTTTYITGQNWPPAVTMVSGAYSCTLGSNQNGDTTEKVVGAHTYCVTIRSEGAAGSTFTDYTYRTGATQVTFTLRFVQCGNYDGAQKTACEAERASFSADQLILNAQI